MQPWLECVRLFSLRGKKKFFTSLSKISSNLSLFIISFEAYLHVLFVFALSVSLLYVHASLLGLLICCGLSIHQTIGDLFCLTLTPHIWHRIGDFWNLLRLVKLLVCTCKKNVSLSLHFQALAPDDLGGFGLFCYSLILTEAPPVLTQTHTHSNNGDDTPFQQLCSRPYEMGQWKSPHLQNHSHNASAFLCSSHYSAPLSLPPLTPCLCEESRKAPFILPWHAVYFLARLVCWAARQCCLAWPSCKPTTSRARRGCHHSWVKVTGPVLKAIIHNMVTATMGTSPIMDKPTTVTWVTHLLGPVHPW